MARQLDDLADRWLTVKDAALYLGVSERTIRRKACALGAVKLGRSQNAMLRFRREDLDAWANRYRLGP